MRDGEWIRGYGWAPTYNKATHPTAADLQIDGGKLSGRFDIDLAPDAWVPHDGSMHGLQVTIDATMSADAIDGTFTAIFDEDRAKATEGRVTGSRADYEAAPENARQ